MVGRIKADIEPQTANIRSKHGIILDCSIASTEPGVMSAEVIDILCQEVKGQRYGFLGDLQSQLQGPGVEIWQWLKEQTTT